MYETKFKDGSDITSYLAVAYAEGFEEPPHPTDTTRSWSYLIGTKLAFSLQGWFGRVATNLIDTGVISETGKINWDLVNTEDDGS